MSRSRRVQRTHPPVSQLEALIRYNERARQRDAAIDAARVNGPMRVPSWWPHASSDRLRAQTNAFVPTAYVPLPRLELPPTPFADALARHRARHEAPPRDDLAGSRARAHEHVMWRASRPELDDPEPVRAAEPVGTGEPIALVRALHDHGRGSWRSTHVARLGAVLDEGIHTADAARAVAMRRLRSGEIDGPLALVSMGAGRLGVASLDLPAALADRAHGEPLVSSIAGTGSTLEWSRIAASLVAVVGLDGIRWL